MESYPKEGRPIEENKKIDVDKIVKEFDEDYRKRFSNITYVESVTSYYPKFKKIIHLPNNEETTKPIDVVLDEFIKNCTDDLEYYLSIKIDVKHDIVNIFIIPVVESA